MKPLIYGLAAISMAFGGSALAKPNKAQGGSPPGQDKRPVDPDKGDDNASATAKLKVSGKSTPAAQRSAIVPQEPDSA